MMELPIAGYFDELHRLGHGFVATDAQGAPVSQDAAFRWAITTARQAAGAGGKLIFIGNGGSAAIASHMAVDYSKTAGLRSIALNDPAALTCLGNDYGYEQVFARQIEWLAGPRDLLIAISSSGASPNILAAVAQARVTGCAVLTLTGFNPENPLRRRGDRNFYIASDRYGFVEISHLSLCHAILDFACRKD